MASIPTGVSKWVHRGAGDCCGYCRVLLERVSRVDRGPGCGEAAPPSVLGYKDAAGGKFVSVGVVEKLAHDADPCISEGRRLAVVGDVGACWVQVTAHRVRGVREVAWFQGVEVALLHRASDESFGANAENLGARPLVQVGDHDADCVSAGYHLSELKDMACFVLFSVKAFTVMSKSAE